MSEVLSTPGTQSLRLEQAKRLHESAIASCLIVETLIIVLSTLFFVNGQIVLGLVWIGLTSLMVGVVYAYSCLYYRGGIDDSNYRPYLQGHIYISCTTGLIWSGVAIYQLNPDSLLSLTIASTIVMSITMGGMFPSSAYRATYLGLLSFCVIPLALYWLVFMPNPLRFFAIGLAIYYVFGLIASARTEINMRDLVVAEQAKRLSTELKRHSDFMETANKEKTQFMVATVHDFSQPLHAQGYFIQALRNIMTDKKQISLLNRIESSWKSQEELIRGVSDMARLDGGLIQPTIMAVDTENLLDNVASEFNGTADQKGIRFNVHLAPAVIRTDPALLSRVVRNILSNAFRYTPKNGRISLESHRVGDKLVLRVKDNGPGIADDDQKRIFEEYVQLDNPQHDRSQGLGIGLSIVRRLATLLDIEIQLESAAGEGTTFTLRLKGKADSLPSTEKSDDSNTIDTAPLVVVVDDEKDIRDGMQALLSGWGCDVICEANGDDAVRSLGEANKEPNLLIADYRISKEEVGLTVIERLRDEVNETIPALLMTGGVATIQGINELEPITLITKPVKPDELKRLIKKHAA